MIADKRTPCARCGVMGKPRKTTALCPDCRLVLSTAEHALWKRGSGVESYHGKEAA